MIEDKINKHTSPIPGRRLITEEGQNVSSPGGMGDNHPTTPHNNPPFASILHHHIESLSAIPPPHTTTHHSPQFFNSSSSHRIPIHHPTTPHNNPTLAPRLQFFIITSNPYPPSHHPTQQPTVRPKSSILLLLSSYHSIPHNNPPFTPQVHFFHFDLHRPPHPLLIESLSTIPPPHTTTHRSHQSFNSSSLIVV